MWKLLFSEGEWTFGWGESTGGGVFLVGEGWVNFWLVGEGLPYPTPVEETLLLPQKSIKNFNPPPFPIWLSPSRRRWKLKAPKDPIKLFIYLSGGRIPRICTLSNLTLFALAKKVSQIWIFPWDLDAFTKFKFKTVFMKPFKYLNCDFF